MDHDKDLQHAEKSLSRSILLCSRLVGLQEELAFSMVCVDLLLAIVLLGSFVVVTNSDVHNARSSKFSKMGICALPIRNLLMLQYSFLRLICAYQVD